MPLHQNKYSRTSRLRQAMTAWACLVVFVAFSGPAHAVTPTTMKDAKAAARSANDEASSARRVQTSAAKKRTSAQARSDRASEAATAAADALTAAGEALTAAKDGLAGADEDAAAKGKVLEAAKTADAEAAAADGEAEARVKDTKAAADAKRRATAKAKKAREAARKQRERAETTLADAKETLTNAEDVLRQAKDALDAARVAVADADKEVVATQKALEAATNGDAQDRVKAADAAIEAQAKARKVRQRKRKEWETAEAEARNARDAARAASAELSQIGAETDAGEADDGPSAEAKAYDAAVEAADAALEKARMAATALRDAGAAAKSAQAAARKAANTLAKAEKTAGSTAAKAKSTAEEATAARAALAEASATAKAADDVLAAKEATAAGLQQTADTMSATLEDQGIKLADLDAVRKEAAAAVKDNSGGYNEAKAKTDALAAKADAAEVAYVKIKDTEDLALTEAKFKTKQILYVKNEKEYKSIIKEVRRLEKRAGKIAHEVSRADQKRRAARSALERSLADTEEAKAAMAPLETVRSAAEASYNKFNDVIEAELAAEAAVAAAIVEAARKAKADAKAKRENELRLAREKKAKAKAEREEKERIAREKSKDDDRIAREKEKVRKEEERVAKAEKRVKDKEQERLDKIARQEQREIDKIQAIKDKEDRIVARKKAAEQARLDKLAAPEKRKKDKEQARRDKIAPGGGEIPAARSVEGVPKAGVSDLAVTYTGEWPLDREEDVPATTRPPVSVGKGYEIGIVSVAGDRAAVYSLEDYDDYENEALLTPMTIADAKEFGAQIERDLKNGGYILASVEVIKPATMLPLGFLKLKVHLGRMEEITIMDGAKRHYTADQIMDMLGWETGQPFNFNRLRQNIFDINTNPNLNVDVRVVGKFGEDGEPLVALVVEGTDSIPLHIGMSLSNTGTKETSDMRLRTTVQHLNLTKHNDIATIEWLTDPSDTQNVNSFSLSWYRPLSSGRSLTVYGGSSESTLKDVSGPLEIHGKGSWFGLAYGRPVYENDDIIIDASVAWTYQSSESENRLSGETFNDRTLKLSMPSLTIGYSRKTYDDSGGRMFASIKLTGNMAGQFGSSGDDQQSSGGSASSQNALADPSFSIITWKIARFQRLFAGDPGPGKWTMFMRLNGQLSDDSLPAAMQMGIGGANSVRGYGEREVIGDFGVTASFELRTPIIDNFIPGLSRSEKFLRDNPEDWAVHRIQFVTFLDLGRVDLVDPSPGEQDSTSFTGAGFGLRLGITKYSQLKLDFAYPLHRSPESKSTRAHVVLDITL